MHINPNGFLILICMAITHIGLIIDLLCGKNILIWFYQKADRFLKKKIFWIPFVLLGTGFLACNFHFKVKKNSGHFSVTGISALQIYSYSALCSSLIRVRPNSIAFSFSGIRLW